MKVINETGAYLSGLGLSVKFLGQLGVLFIEESLRFLVLEPCIVNEGFKLRKGDVETFYFHSFLGVFLACIQLIKAFIEVLKSFLVSRGSHGGLSTLVNVVAGFLLQYILSAANFQTGVMLMRLWLLRDLLLMCGRLVDEASNLSIGWRDCAGRRGKGVYLHRAGLVIATRAPSDTQAKLGRQFLDSRGH